jgi:hypothetical protein
MCELHRITVEPGICRGEPCLKAMTDLAKRADRHTDLRLSDFSADPEEIAHALPAEPFLIARKGKPAGPLDMEFGDYRESP